MNPSPRDPLDQWLSEQPTDPREIQKWAARMPMQEPVTPPPKPEQCDPHRELRESVKTLQREIADLRGMIEQQHAALEQQRNECWQWITETCDGVGAITGPMDAKFSRKIADLNKRLDSLAKPRAVA